MTAGAKAGTCPKCGKVGLIMPLHLDKGGPEMCLDCGMDWHAKDTRRRKFGRVLSKAARLYYANGGRDAEQIVSMAPLAALGVRLGRRLDPLGYADDAIGVEVGDITLELLNDVLQLVHPDHHPPEREALARRVTQNLLAMKPLVFPAPPPKPAKEAPERDEFRPATRLPFERAVTGASLSLRALRRHRVGLLLRCLQGRVGPPPAGGGRAPAGEGRRPAGERTGPVRAPARSGPSLPAAQGLRLRRRRRRQTPRFQILLARMPAARAPQAWSPAPRQLAHARKVKAAKSILGLT